MPRYINVLEVLSGILQCLNQVNQLLIGTGLRQLTCFWLRKPCETSMLKFRPLSNVKIESDTSVSILQIKFEVYLTSLLTLRTDLLSLCLVDFGFCVHIMFCGAAALRQGRAGSLEANHCCCRHLSRIILVVMVVMFITNNIADYLVTSRNLFFYLLSTTFWTGISKPTQQKAYGYSEYQCQLS